VWNKKENYIKKWLDFCPEECDSVTYSLSTSLSEYPEPLYAQNLIKSSFLNSTFTDIKSNYSNLKKSVLAFSVYYSELKYTEIRELEKLGLVDLICAIGGTMGLFVGASLLSFVEILEGTIGAFLVYFKRSNTLNIINSKN
jgi:hypothetical protein